MSGDEHHEALTGFPSWELTSPKPFEFRSLERVISFKTWAKKWLRFWCFTLIVIHYFYKVKKNLFNCHLRRAVILLKAKKIEPLTCYIFRLERRSWALKLAPCIFPSIIWQNCSDLLSNIGLLPCFDTMEVFTFLPKGLFTIMQPCMEASYRKSHRTMRAPLLIWVPAERQRFNENKEARPHRE